MGLNLQTSHVNLYHSLCNSSKGIGASLLLFVISNSKLPLSLILTLRKAPKLVPDHLQFLGFLQSLFSRLFSDYLHAMEITKSLDLKKKWSELWNQKCCYFAQHLTLFYFLSCYYPPRITYLKAFNSHNTKCLIFHPFYIYQHHSTTQDRSTPPSHVQTLPFFTTKFKRLPT